MKLENYTIMAMSKKGFTLVELIVSFTVLAILLSGIIALLPSFFNQYNHVQNTARTQSIGTTLLEMLEGQLGYATSTINIVTTNSDDFDIIEFDDKDGNEVKLSVLTDSFKDYLGTSEDYEINENNNKLAENLFIFHYTETKSVENVDKTLRDAVNWGYNDDFYMNNIVKEFHVELAGSEYRKNVLRVSFVLANSRNGMENKFTRLIECSNFKNTANNGITVDDENISNDQNGSGSITITDSSGVQHTFNATLDWNEVKEKINKEGWNTVQGGILSDGKNFYLIYYWSLYIPKDESDFTLEQLANKYQNIFIKLEPTTKLWIESDCYDKGNGAGVVWRPIPQVGDLCYYKGHYYVVPSPINENTFPPSGWVQLYQDGR